MTTIPAPTLTIANATLSDGTSADLTISGGRIEEIRPGTVQPPSASVTDLTGYVLVPSFVEPHAHLDKALTINRFPRLTGDLREAIDLMDRAAADFTVEDMISRADRALSLYLQHGTTAVRTHVTLGGSFALRALEAMVDVRRRWRGIVDVQLVAMAGIPVERSQLESALAQGADLVGGYPHADPQPLRAMELCFDVAASAGVALDLHTDETLDPAILTLEAMAQRVLAGRFPMPITASHCVSLGMQHELKQRDVSRLVARAGIAIVTCPQTNLYLLATGMRTAVPRGLTALTALQEAGVVIAGGGDNVRDVFHPLGRADPLETANLLVTAGQRKASDALAMVTSGARSALSLPQVDVTVGSHADLVAVKGSSLLDILATGHQDRMVWRRGHRVATTTVTRDVSLPASSPAA